MKKIIAALSSLIIFSQTCFARDLGSWAENDFIRLSSRGILTIETVTGDMSQSITRGEFCKLVTNIYTTENKISLSENELDVFSDTNDEYILKAYKLGIVSGKGDGKFYPSEQITRQEMAVMISRLLKKISDSYTLYTNQISAYNKKYRDSSLTDQWALADMAAVNSCGIINGNDENFVEPKSYATREQAVCMLNRVYDLSVTSPTAYQYPTLKRFNDLHITTHKISLEWSYTPNVEKYTVIVKQEGAETVTYDVSPTKRSISSFDTGLDGEKEITVYIAARLINGVWLFSKPVSSLGTSAPEEQTASDDGNSVQDTASGAAEDNTTEAEPSGEVAENTADENNSESESNQTETTIPDTSQDTQTDSTGSTAVAPTPALSQLNEKEARVFPCGYYFTTEEEAQSYMVEVTVPVWVLTDSGEKKSSQKYITVNSALADDVVSIFTEIYNDPSQFPIKDVGGFAWRNTASGKVSQHSYGTCIDINWNENYYVKPDGTPIVGSHWLPGEDPYSIAENSIVVTTFAKYGWGWGGNAWSDKYAKDYMHFTFLGK